MIDEITELLVALTAEYPVAFQAAQRQDVSRQAFQLRLTVNLAPAGAVADIGGGAGLFSVGCAAAGMTVTLIDDFGDQGSSDYGNKPMQVHRQHNVNILRRDVIASGLGLDTESMDVITSFDSMEHWHFSPKALFAEVVMALKPGGWFLLGAPNCVNLRKRITVPFGRGKWSPMEDWYEQPVFRGHVREPDVDDLQYIASDMELTDVSIMGRNWQGYVNRTRWVRTLTPYVDRLLQLRPSLCSDLYMLGRKPR